MPDSWFFRVNAGITTCPTVSLLVTENQLDYQSSMLALLRVQLYPWGQRINLLDALPQLQMPTLLIWGEKDMIVPKSQAEIAVQRLQRGSLSIIPDCGHIPPLEQPDRFVAALEQFFPSVSV